MTFDHLHLFAAADDGNDKSCLSLRADNSSLPSSSSRPFVDCPADLLIPDNFTSRWTESEPVAPTPAPVPGPSGAPGERGPRGQEGPSVRPQICINILSRCRTSYSRRIISCSHR